MTSDTDQPEEHTDQIHNSGRYIPVDPCLINLPEQFWWCLSLDVLYSLFTKGIQLSLP